ncbi:DUF6670 family protein [Jongsikchunia kroppenstedtii]|uniref:DUF6670 family protein n=1 Tax=Jongsikchunia kroppenstedtii TaxID=1121721 RepID=UPI0003730250|nr:DUF6670 family protein [Jongsikchunia kroppenstedtii]
MQALDSVSLNILAPLFNRTGRLNGHPFDPATPLHLPQGKWKIIHFGMMIPDLPDPIRFFDIIAILGTASRVPAFAAPSLLTTDPDDAAWLLVGSGTSRDNFHCYSAEQDCDFADDVSRLRWGDQLTITRTDERITVHANPKGLRAELTVRPTREVSHFAHLPGLYDHWSILCEYTGTFMTDDGTVVESSGLTTWEYARGRSDVPLPIYVFTYQILNISPRVQVLLVELLGPGGVAIQRTVYVRDLDGESRFYTKGFTHSVSRYLPHTTPDGVEMALPAELSWSVLDDHGHELITIRGKANDDYAYGMAGGFAGSYEYTGRYKRRPIEGTAYIEWIDRRKQR